MDKIKTLQDLAVQLTQNQALQDEIKKDPAGTIAKLASPLQTDKWIYRIVVLALGLTILLTIIGALVLAGFGKEVPAAILTIASSAGGGLIGLLAPSPKE